MADSKKILIIDTASGNNVSLICDDKTYEINDNHPKCDNFVVLIDQILKQAKIKLNDLDAVAVNVGPGSFTGLRVGVTLAKGLSVAIGLSIIAFTTFEVASYNKCEPIIVLDGFSDYVYTNWPNERCVNINDLKMELGKTQKQIISSEKIAQKLQNVGISHLNCDRYNVVLQKFNNSDFTDVDALEPHYLRLSQAEIEKQKREGKSES